VSTAGILVGMLLPEAPLGDGEVVLRAWQPEDAEWYASVARDPEIQRWTSEPDDPAAGVVRDAIVQMHATRAHAGMVVIDAGSGRLLGNAGLSRSREDPEIGEISYWLAPDARGRGTATRAVRLLIGWARECGLRRVELFTHVDNIASQRVAERAGMRRDRVVAGYRVIKGETWDAVIYVLDLPPRTTAAPLPA
jgi:ribosomal-protein-alanine N-acetyltransferase